MCKNWSFMNCLYRASIHPFHINPLVDVITYVGTAPIAKQYLTIHAVVVTSNETRCIHVIMDASVVYSYSTVNPSQGHILPMIEII